MFLNAVNYMIFDFSTKAEAADLLFLSSLGFIFSGVIEMVLPLIVSVSAVGRRTGRVLNSAECFEQTARLPFANVTCKSPRS